MSEFARFAGANEARRLPSGTSSSRAYAIYGELPSAGNAVAIIEPKIAPLSLCDMPAPKLARLAPDASRSLADIVIFALAPAVPKDVNEYELRRTVLGHVKHWALAFDVVRTLAPIRQTITSAASRIDVPSWRQLELSTLVQRLVTLSANKVPARAIATRILELAQQSREDGEDDINFDSLRYFLFALFSLSPSKTPQLSLAPGGNVYATWRDRGNLFSVMFLPSGSTGWVHFRPLSDEETGAEVERESGTTLANQLARKVRELRVSEWI